MATASGGRASIVTASSSSFGQFRLTQFVDNAPPPNAATDAQHTPLGILNENENANLDPNPMAQASRPSSGQTIDRPPSAAPSRPPPQNNSQASASPAGFGTVELAELTANPLVEGILGPNKDGRVRNPVPSKLKGKTDNKQGNFGVMHMGMSPGKKNDVPGRDAAAERDAAARRTSENTALRAKAAQQEKYVPPKRRGLGAGVNEGHPAASRASPFAGPREDYKQRARPLAPDETKFEQARLLTLLRSINPVTVVDQICKAVAYFGGIPGAPPPEDGIFPESANTRETGALFIGWLAEIFPDLSSPGPPGLPEPPGKKGRGRPSKGDNTLPVNEPPNPRNGFGYGQAIAAPAWGLPQSLAAVNPHAPSSTPDGGQTSNIGPTQNAQSENARPATPSKQQPEAGQPATTSTSKRGRGRPKGSRNKGKSDPQNSTEPAGSSNNDVGSQNQVSTGEQAHQSPEMQGASGKGAQSDAPVSMQTTGDKTGGAKQPQGGSYQEQSWQNNSQKVQAEPPSNVTPAPMDELSPEERAVLEAFRQHDVPDANATTPNLAPAKGPLGVGMKRKRPPTKPKNGPPPPNPSSEQMQSTPTISSALPPSNEESMDIAKDALQWASVGNSTSAGPAAKRQRQRKPKTPGVNEPPSRNQTGPVGSSATPPVAPSTLPDSTTNSSQQSVPVSRPPAEGLQAHYERFAGLPQQLPQQNGRNHMPSITQQQQQQLLQQQIPTTSVPAQSQQMPAQQMQQQKSQQGSQREDQKVSQGTSARSSSTGFYNQRSHGSTYNQQYPSHQPSQLYSTHQASPQLSNSSNNSNSYRTTSTHTMAQASPQFSQTESSYRTSSPHTISLPSPSFNQSDNNNFRSASVHGIAQPSPTYTQAENNYRTSSTHSITQPSSSFSRAHTQTQPSHQNHYNHFADNPYVDLPTLESLGHGGSSSNAGVNMNTGAYGQGIGVGLGASSSSRSGSNSLYGSTSSGLNNAFDTGTTTDLLRGVSRPPAGGSNVYGTSSGLGNAFDPGTGEQEMRERLLRNIGGRR